MGAKELQERMEEIQKNNSFEGAFSKLVSGGKAGYKAAIEKPREFNKCKECGNILSGQEKFCPECGFKVNQD